MTKNTALIIAGSAAAPLVGTRLTDPQGSDTLRKITLGTALGTGLWYLLTKSRTAGAVALGTGGAWTVMKVG